MANDVIPLDAVRLAPCTHDEGVVVGDHSDDVDAFRLDGRKVLDVAWQMLHRTTRCEGTLGGLYVSICRNLLSLHSPGRPEMLAYIPGTENSTTFLFANSLLAL